MGVAPSLSAPSMESHPFRTEMSVSTLPPRQCEGLRGPESEGGTKTQGRLQNVETWMENRAGHSIGPGGRSRDTPTGGGRPRGDRQRDPRFALRRGGGTAVTTGQTPVCWPVLGLAVPFTPLLHPARRLEPV